MKIDVYARCWNERDMVPFFFVLHKLTQRYIIYGDVVDISRLDLRPWETREGPRWWCYCDSVSVK